MRTRRKMDELMSAHTRNMRYLKRCETQAVILHRRFKEIRTRYIHARQSKQWQWVYRHHMRMLIVEGLIVVFHSLATKTFHHLVLLEESMARREASHLDSSILSDITESSITDSELDVDFDDPSESSENNMSDFDNNIADPGYQIIESDNNNIEEHASRNSLNHVTYSESHVTNDNLVTNFPVNMQESERGESEAPNNLNEYSLSSDEIFSDSELGSLIESDNSLTESVTESTGSLTDSSDSPIGSLSDIVYTLR